MSRAIARSAGAAADSPYRERFDPELGPGPGFLNAPGQATRTVGAVDLARRQRSTPASSPPTAAGPRSSAAAAAKLAAIAPNRTPQTVELDGLGRYRVIALHARHGGQTIVTGLPTAVVDDTLLWVLGMFCVRRRDRADRRDDRGHPDHPAPTRAAVKGFRGRPRGRRPRARQG